MSTLQESRCYGLSGGKLNLGANVSVFHVKLTDSAATAIGSFQNAKGWSSHPTICFNGNQGKISIPCSENRDDRRIFSFDVTNVACENPNGSFDCVQQLGTGAAEELSCLGVIQKKMKVKATDDSYDKVRQSMALAVEETLSRGAIVIKQEGLGKGKKVRIRAPAPALASLTKPRPSPQNLLSGIKRRVSNPKVKKGTCALGRKSTPDTQERPLRERVTHLLALRPYRRPDLLLRLQKDGLTAAEKGLLGSILTEVGLLHSKDNTYTLKDGLYKELQKDWPGYTAGDQQLLKRILVRRLFKPQQKLLTVPEAQVSPLRETPNSSPAHRPKPLLTTEEYTDPLASKRPRISHFSGKTAGDRSRSRPSEQQTVPKDVPEVTTGTDGKGSSLDPRKLFDSLTVVSQREEEAAKRLTPTSCFTEESEKEAAQTIPSCDRPPSPLVVPDLNKHTIKRKRSKHKHQDQEKDGWRDKKERRRDQKSEELDSKVSPDRKDPSESLFDSKALPEDKGTPEYLSTYTGIRSHEQRMSYKLDFNREYSEYRDLHARIDGVTRQFMELDTQLKQLHCKSHKYKTVHNQILQEYRKIKKSNPNFNQDRSRCEYLHNKLAHIKKIISAYDQKQLGLCPQPTGLTADH